MPRLIGLLLTTALVTSVVAAPARADRRDPAARSSWSQVQRVLACDRALGSTSAERGGCLAGALAPRRTVGATNSPTTLPVCVDQASELNSRCELWSRQFNDRSPDGSIVHDVPAASAVNRKGDRLFVATTTTVGAAPSRLTVAALSATDGASLWVAHLPTPYTTTASVLTLSPDESTVLVAGTLKYLPNLNAAPLVYWVVAGFAAKTGKYLWATVQKTGVLNTPVQVRVAPRGDRVFVTGYSVFSGYARPYVEWVTVAYSAKGKRLWLARYEGQAGGQNWPVGLTVSPNGRTIYVAGASEHPQTTGNYSWDYGVVAYAAATGKKKWVTITRVGSDNEPVSLAMSPSGSRLYVTGTGTFGTTSAPVSGILTIGYSTATGKAEWTSRFLAADNQSAVARALALSPAGDRLVLAAAVGQKRVVVEGTLEPSVLTMTALALDPKTGHQAWALPYAPDPDYSALPTTLTIAKTGAVYLVGIVGPPALLAVYPVTVALTSAGKKSWVARWDLRDPGGVGVGAAGFPAWPVAAATDAAGARLYESMAYYPASVGGPSTECDTAHSAGVQQDCKATGQSDLVVAYAK